MIEFLLSLLFAILTGTATFGGASSMTSEDTNPNESFAIEWPCALFWSGDVEYCYIYYDNGVWETGP